MLLHYKGILMNIDECCCCYPASNAIHVLLGASSDIQLLPHLSFKQDSPFYGMFNFIKLYQISFLEVRRLLSNDHIFPRGLKGQTVYNCILTQRRSISAESARCRYLGAAANVTGYRKLFVAGQLEPCKVFL